MIHLGINVDHVATVRQARGSLYPDPVFAGLQAELAGADVIHMHLTVEREHIQEHDVERFVTNTQTRLVLECAAMDDIRDFALRVKPTDVCLVPELISHRDKSGGFDVINHQDQLTDFVAAFQESGIRNTLVVTPEEAQIEAAARVGSAGVELDARAYSTSSADPAARSVEIARLVTACDFAYSLGLNIAVGRGLQYDNIQPIAAIETIEELTVGHAVIARALYFGLPEAVAEMKRRIMEARQRG